MTDYKIPGSPRTACSTPSTYAMIQLLGGESHDGVTFSRQEIHDLKTFYGFGSVTSTVEECRDLHAKAQAVRDSAPRRPYDPPVTHKPFNEEGVTRLYEAGSMRNLFRYMDRDARRVMAALVKHLEPGEDPVIFVLNLMREVGYDVVDHYGVEEDSDEEDPSSDGDNMWALGSGR